MTPRILFLTSRDSSEAVATPLLAALEVQEAQLRALDVGRLGADGGGAVEWVMRALGGELSERKLEREVEQHPPDAACAMELGAVLALCELRDNSARGFPVSAVIPELSPSAAWAQCSADRFLVMDDEAAVALSDHGVDSDRIVVVGAFAEASYAQAAAQGRDALRRRFKLTGKVVVVEVAGLGPETVSQLALQLSLVGAEATYMFDAGSDRDAATALRTQVPALGLRAKLFGVSDEAPLYWRCADAVVARPGERAALRCLLLGTPLVCLTPEGHAAQRRSSDLEARGAGAVANSPLMVSSALERLLASPPAASGIAGLDGAGGCAAVMQVLALNREAIVEERASAQAASVRAGVEDAAGYAKWAAQASAPAGSLEDLGGAGPAPRVPPRAELERLRKEVQKRRERVSRTVADAQKQAGSWEAKRASAEEQGNRQSAQQAERNADLERARMHAALQEMAELQAEEKRLDEAAEAAETFQPPPAATAAPPPRGGGTSTHARPSVDDELDRLKRSAGSADSSGASSGRTSSKKSAKSGKKQRGGAGTSTVDDELAALKRKMAARKRKR
jgi:UDP-N-acetylglucosamine:LPS N-acetylglucosamine transferase